jgi:hypothetical protein
MYRPALFDRSTQTAFKKLELLLERPLSPKKIGINTNEKQTKEILDFLYLLAKNAQ